jgi:hypothetical protein
MMQHLVGFFAVSNATGSLITIQKQHAIEIGCGSKSLKRADGPYSEFGQPIGSKIVRGKLLD